MVDVKHFDRGAALDSAMRLFWRNGARATAVRDIVSVTGVSGSSLYATFGGKTTLFLAAMDRYLADQTAPGLAELAGDGRGIAAVADFFGRLIGHRCSGDQAGWGCFMVNTHASADSDDPDVRERLDRHFDAVRAALRAALAAEDRLRPEVDGGGAADQLALLAYGLNLRSRCGADAAQLARTVDATLRMLTVAGR